MACLAVDTDLDWGLACLTLLQTGSELERMGRNHTVVVAKAEAINSVFIRIYIYNANLLKNSRNIVHRRNKCRYLKI